MCRVPSGLLSAATTALLALLWPGGAIAQDAPKGARRELFPGTHLVAPLLANPREPGFRTSLVRAWSPRDLDALLGVAEQGGTFGLVRWGGDSNRVAVQLDVTGSASAQFDLSTVHWDLLNTDFTFGFPVTARRGPSSVRLRIYHLSSHLGDEFIRRDSIWVWGDPPPIPPGFKTYHQSYRFESAELVVARELGDWRVYAGADFFWYRAPRLLDRGMALAGVELNRPLRGGPAGRFALVAALDATMLEYRDWRPAWTFRSGIDVGRAGDRWRRGRRAAVLLEFHDGPAPFGQFAMRTTVRYIGGGLFLSL